MLTRQASRSNLGTGLTRRELTAGTGTGFAWRELIAEPGLVLLGGAYSKNRYWFRERSST